MDIVEKARNVLKRHLGEEVFYQPTEKHAPAFYVEGKWGFVHVAYLKGNVIFSTWNDENERFATI